MRILLADEWILSWRLSSAVTASAKERLQERVGSERLGEGEPFAWVQGERYECGMVVVGNTEPALDQRSFPSINAVIMRMRHQSFLWLDAIGYWVAMTLVLECGMRRCFCLHAVRTSLSQRFLVWEQDDSRLCHLLCCILVFATEVARDLLPIILFFGGPHQRPKTFLSSWLTCLD